MPLEDLDLEFEDEEDLKRKRNSETVQQNVELEFGAAAPVAASAAKPALSTAAPKASAQSDKSGPIVPTITKSPTATAPTAKAPPVASPAANSAPTAQVKRLDEARQALKKPTGVPPSAASASPGAARPQIQGANALNLDLPPDTAGLSELYAELESTKFEARVQVAVAEFKTEILSELLSDVKVLDMQVHQLLVRITQKHPELRPEVMALKKLLADFATKKRK